jgi:putative transposase
LESIGHHGYVFLPEAVEEAILHYGTPKIMNTDQGSQFTSQSFTGFLKEYNIKISMGGKGSWRDNVFIERLWRSVKYEGIYLRAYDSVSEVKIGLNRYFNFYNSRRPHSSLAGKTPDQIYLNTLPQVKAA